MGWGDSEKRVRIAGGGLRSVVWAKVAWCTWLCNVQRPRVHSGARIQTPCNPKPTPPRNQRVHLTKSTCRHALQHSQQQHITTSTSPHFTIMQISNPSIPSFVSYNLLPLPSFHNSHTAIITMPIMQNRRKKKEERRGGGVKSSHAHATNQPHPSTQTCMQRKGGALNPSITGLRRLENAHTSLLPPPTPFS